MTNLNAVKKFVKDWSGHGYEKGETQKFWFAFLRDVFGEDTPEMLIDFEDHVSSGFIDGYISDTHVLIEQKSIGVPLDDSVFAQAKKYDDAQVSSSKARWIITCNFREFLIYDMEKPNPVASPVKILLDELPEKFHDLDFIVNPKRSPEENRKLTKTASNLVGKLYKTVRKLYVDPNSTETLKSLNKLCVRIVFCLYAESADVFSKHKMFFDYLNSFKNDRYSFRDALIKLFDVLKTEMRSPYLSDELQNFPYVDGGLFNDEKFDFPDFKANARDILLNELCKFNWTEIRPTIFGTVFEDTIDPKEKERHGINYTDPENIEKVIKPLFMDDLKDKFIASKSDVDALFALQRELASLKIFDPACGSGNFLTESYLLLRELENKIIAQLVRKGVKFSSVEDAIKVSIEQFFGLEINGFAVAVAKTALWISEIQMRQKTAEILNLMPQHFPLKKIPHILEANALRYDWSKLISPSACNFIISNPPFVGKSYQSKEQKSDMAEVFVGVKGYGNLDYVASWYKKAADFIHGTKIRCAFVSTNSICQGIAVPPLWKYLFESGIHIDFAYKTFKWFSESSQLAQVHVVIIAFSHAPNPKPKKIFSVGFELNDEGKKVEKIYAETARNINAYLVDAPNIIIEPRANSICNVLPMIVGSCPTDGGGFIIEAEDYEAFVNAEPAALKYIRLYIGGEEFINGKKRYCLWLKDCPPNELRSMKKVFERVKAVKEFRLSSKKEQTRRRAETPTLFAEDRYVNAPAIFMPMVSSENRDYVPIGFIDAETIANNKSLFIPNGNNYIFGVLISKVHMAWMKTVCGRLKSDYSYSATIVYNNFPWCSPTAGQRRAIEAAAAKILEVRAKYAESSLADLYDATAMPADLKRAHRENDAAVLAAYGFAQNLSEAHNS